MIPLQSTLEQDAAQARHALVRALVASKAIRTVALEQAFLSIPREVFVPRFYEQDETRTTMTWREINAQEMSAKEYLALIYRDEPLVTQLDARRMPISSSSMPSAMAKMLEALDVQPGQRVLEIGTGTGYNAALLAHLVIKPYHVTSIDYDAGLAQNAAAAIARVGGPAVQIITGDGWRGYAAGAPFDRIIATASVPTVPLAWVAQVRVGGKLVMDLHGSLASGFLVLERTPEGASGHFLAEPLYFMPLVTPDITTHASTVSHSSTSETIPFTLAHDDLFPALLFESAFRWLLQWRLPGCQITTRKQQRTPTTRTTIIVSDTQMNATVRFHQVGGEETWTGETEQQAGLWDTLQQIAHEYLALGKPHPSQYRLVIEDQQIMLLIGSQCLPLSTERAKKND